MPTSPRGLTRGGSAPSVLPAAQLALSDQHTFFGVDLAALELPGDSLELPPRDPLPQHAAADAADAANVVGARDAHDPVQDSKLQQLAAELEVAESSFAEDEAASLRKQIAAREVTLLPLYVQVSHEFADLHDRPGRMVAKGVIRDVVPWAEARPYFYHRVRRRLAQDALVKALQAVDADLVHQDGVALVRGWCDAGSNLKLRLTLTSDPDPNLTLTTQT